MTVYCWGDDRPYRHAQQWRHHLTACIKAIDEHFKRS